MLPLKNALKSFVEDSKRVFALCAEMSHVLCSAAAGLNLLLANRTIQSVHSKKYLKFIVQYNYEL